MLLTFVQPPSARGRTKVGELTQRTRLNSRTGVGSRARRVRERAAQSCARLPLANNRMRSVRRSCAIVLCTSNRSTGDFEKKHQYLYHWSFALDSAGPPGADKHERLKALLRLPSRGKLTLVRLEGIVALLRETRCFSRGLITCTN